MSTVASPTTPPTVRSPRITSRSTRFLQGLAVAVLLAAIGWVALQLLVASEPVPAPPIGATQVDETVETARLVARGLVPAATLQPTRGQRADTARLEAQSRVPAATLQPTRGEDADTARLVARGLVPSGTLRPTGEQALTEALIDRGLIPAGSQP